MQLTIEFSKPSPSANTFKGPSGTKKEWWHKQGWEKELTRYMHDRYPGHDPAAHRKETVVFVTRYSSKQLDYDNLVGGAKKCIVDILKRQKLIIDDDPDSTLVLYQQFPSKQKDARTMVQIYYVGKFGLDEAKWEMDSAFMAISRIADRMSQ